MEGWGSLGGERGGGCTTHSLLEWSPGTEPGPREPVWKPCAAHHIECQGSASGPRVLLALPRPILPRHPASAAPPSLPCQVNSATYTSGPVLVSLAAFAAYTWAGHPLTAAVAFPALALFNLLRFPIIMIPTQVGWCQGWGGGGGGRGRRGRGRTCEELMAMGSPSS